MVPSGWKKAELGEYIVEHRKKSTTQDEYDVFTSSRKGLVLQSEYFSGSRLAAKDNIGYNILPDNHITYRSRSDDGIFVFNINKTGSTGIISHFYPVFKIQNGDIGFFLELLNSYRRKIGAFSVGTSQTVLSMNALKKVKLNIPPLPEQKKIARILSTWDKAIETVDKLIENSQQQKKALMQQLLTGKKRLPGFSGEWKSLRLGDCAESLDNRRIPLNGEQRSEMQGDIPYYGANGLLDHVNKHIFDETIVLLAEDGGYFDEFATRPIAQLIRGKSWVNNHAHVLKAKPNTTEEWLFYSLVHKNILGFVAGGTRAKLNKSDMLKIPLTLAPLEEQLAIVRVLEAQDKIIVSQNAEREKLLNGKKALMQQLLTGKCRVQVTE